MTSLFGSLQLQLLLGVFLIVLPLAGLTAHMGLQQSRTAMHATQQQALRMARLAADEQVRIIDGAQQLLVALASSPGVHSHDADACALLFADVLRRNSLYQNMVAVTADGDVFYSVVEPQAPVNVSGHVAFQRTLATKGFVAGQYAVSPITGIPTMTFAYPALDAAGGVRAVVAATIDLGWLGQFMNTAGLPAGSTLSVVDDLGAVLAHCPDAEEWIGRVQPPPVMQPILARSDGLHEGIGRDGAPSLYAFARLCGLDSGAIYVHVGIPKSAAFADANRTLARNMITLGAATLLVLALAWSGGRQLIVRPVQVLLDMIWRFEAGDLHARVCPAAGEGELGRVALALDQMAATVEAREHELRLHSARAEALRAIAACLNAHLELERVLDTVCREAARALGVPAASVRLCGADQEAFHLAANWGWPEELHQRIPALPPEIMALFRQGQVALITDVAARPEQPEVTFFDALGIRTFVGAPMRHKGQVVGALFVWAGDQVRHFTDDEVGFLQAIAHQAASAVANARLYEELKLEQRKRGELLRNLISAQEEERKRIARELHDETSQGLSALIVSLETMGIEMTGASRPLQTARSVAASLLEGIRRLIGDLRPSLLDDLGLVPAIAWYAEQRLGALSVEVGLQCSLPEETRLPAPLETALFRIAQEAISNIARHAGATRVAIGLRVANDRAILSIEDDGRGFEPASDLAPAAQGRGLGLQGMRERAKILGGEFRLRTAPGQGVRLEVELPFLMGEIADEQDTSVIG